MNWTLEKMQQCEQLQDGRMVKVKVSDDIFSGKIVGCATNGLIPQYIVECTDGFIPNDTYKYKTAVIQLSMLIID